ncbi:MAG: 4-hydroxy-tetrahydrodipicolinate reductase [Pseudomonadota bacterium]
MKIAVSGAAGRMGKRILALGRQHPEVEITGALEMPGHPAIGTDAGESAGIGRLGVAITDDRAAVIAGCDVFVDFSSPDASLANAVEAAARGKALVVGTTGFSEAGKKAFLDAAGTTRTVFAPNMSRGVNLLFSLTEQVAAVLGSDYDVEILEAHHRLKKDAPSGTAKRLAEGIAKALNRDLGSVGVYGREGMVGERKPEEIAVLAVRGGDIVGEHTVMFVTNGERIELTHRAHSRDALAGGAIQAALWVASRPVGVYDMQDVLGLRS